MLFEDRTSIEILLAYLWTISCFCMPLHPTVRLGAPPHHYILPLSSNHAWPSHHTNACPSHQLKWHLAQHTAYELTEAIGTRFGA